jgi:hypothetical protein
MARRSARPRSVRGRASLPPMQNQPHLVLRHSFAQPRVVGIVAHRTVCGKKDWLAAAVS